jgi:hypothetical protein
MTKKFRIEVKVWIILPHIIVAKSLISKIKVILIINDNRDCLKGKFNEPQIFIFNYLKYTHFLIFKFITLLIILK